MTVTKIQKQLKDGRFISAQSFRGGRPLRRRKHGRTAELMWQDQMVEALHIPGYQEAESFLTKLRGWIDFSRPPSRPWASASYLAQSLRIAPHAAKKC